jgi:hypothetical protein
MSKISSLAKDSAKTINDPILKIAFITGFENGFEAAFTVLREQTLAKVKHLKQYEMMTERIFALKTYMDTMDEMLKGMK